MATSQDASAAQITELYRSILGRNPDQGGLEYWDSTGKSADEIAFILREARDKAGSAENALFAKSQGILKDISGLAKNNELSITDIVKYAKDNNVSYQDVVQAVEAFIPNVTVDSLQYEQARQNLSKYADSKNQVSLVDAIKAASEFGVDTKNLAKFFSMTPEVLANTINTNAKYLADSKLFDTVAIDQVAALTGADLSALNGGKRSSEIGAALDAAKDSKGQITYADAIGVGSKLGLSDDELAGYIGVKPEDLANYRTTTDIQAKITDAKSDGKLTLDEIIGIQSDTDKDFTQFVQDYFAGSAEEKAALVSQLNARNSLTPELRAAQDAIAGMADPKTNQIDLGKLYDYAKANNLNPADIAGFVNQQPDALAQSFADIPVNRRLQEASADGLSVDEILGEVGTSKMSIEDFVNRYLAPENKQQLIESLNTESAFTPEERALRRDFVSLGQQTGMDKALEFASQKGLSDEDASRILGINASDIGSYRRSEFISQGLNQAMGGDNQLGYDEIYRFSKDNNVPLDELINYLGNPDERNTLKTGIQSYIDAAEADAKMAPAERLTQQLTDVTGGGKQSGVWDKNNGWDHHLQKMVNYLEGYGISDLRQIGTKVENRMVQDLAPAIQSGDDFRQADEIVESEAPFVVYYDKSTGKELHAVPQSQNGGYWEFGSEGQGKGSTGYFIGPSSGGSVGVTSSWREKYGAQEYALPLMFVAAIAAPYLLPEVIGTATGMTAAEAASLGLSANSGLAGILVEAGMSIPAAQAAATVIANGVYKGVSAEMAGGDFNQGFIAGGIAPWMAQYATNWAADNLPTGTNPAVARTVGLAVGQLMSTGEIDPKQLAASALAPQAVEKLVKATNGAITPNQAKLLFTTLATGGENITAMASNPMAVLNFVQQNKGLFDEILTNKPISEIGKKLNISALDNSQQKFFTEDGALQYPGSRYEGIEFPQVAGELVPGIHRVNEDGSISVGRDKETGLEVRLNPETNELYTTQNVWNEPGTQVLMYSSRYKPYDPFDIQDKVPAGLITQAKEIKAQQPIGLAAALSPSTSLNQSQAAKVSTSNAQAGQTNQQVGVTPGATSTTLGSQPGADMSVASNAGKFATANVLSVSPGTAQAIVTGPDGKPVLVNTSNLSGAQINALKPGQNVVVDTATGTIIGGTPGTTGTDLSQNTTGTPAGGLGSLTNVSGVPSGVTTGTPLGITGGVNVINGPGSSLTTTGTNNNVSVNNQDVKTDLTDVVIDQDDKVDVTTTGGQTTVLGGQTTVTGGKTTGPGAKVTVPGGQTTTTGGFDFFFPVAGQQQTDYITYDMPTVGAPELPAYNALSAPNYLRAIGPYLPLGIGALMEAMNASKQGNGNNQSVQNAQGQAQGTP